MWRRSQSESKSELQKLQNASVLQFGTKHVGIVIKFIIYNQMFCNLDVQSPNSVYKHTSLYF